MLILVMFIFIIFLVLSNIFLYAKAYFYKTDGDMVINKQDGKTIFSLNLNEDPGDFHSKNVIIFKVVDESNEDS